MRPAGGFAWPAIAIAVPILGLLGTLAGVAWDRRRDEAALALARVPLETDSAIDGVSLMDVVRSPWTTRRGSIMLYVSGSVYSHSRMRGSVCVIVRVMGDDSRELKRAYTVTSCWGAFAVIIDFGTDVSSARAARRIVVTVERP